MQMDEDAATTDAALEAVATAEQDAIFAREALAITLQELEYLHKSSVDLAARALSSSEAEVAKMQALVKELVARLQGESDRASNAKAKAVELRGKIAPSVAEKHSSIAP